jgi:manganese oxidase
MPDNRTSRRDFLQKSALSAIALGTIAACAKDEASAAQQGNAAAPSSGGTMGAHETAPATAAATAAARAEEMDAMHEKGIKAFPAKTATWGNQLLAPRVDKGVKVYDLTAKVVRWETEPGKFVTKFVTGWGYNGVVPGPQIRVREGDRVRVNLKNELPESTAMHFHGLEVPIDQDGVPFITQPPIKPGELHVRVHRAERGLAHVPLASQRGEAGRPRAPGRVHRRAEAEKSA